jgi:hypothetical protein
VACKIYRGFIVVFFISNFAQARGQFTNSLLKLDEMNLIAGASISEQIQLLPNWLAKNFKILPTCDSGFVLGLDDLRCLIGMRQLTEDLIESKIQLPDEIVRVTISHSKTWKSLNAWERQVVVSIPYDATKEQLRLFFLAEFSRPEFRSRQNLFNEIRMLNEEIQAITSTKIEVDQSLTLNSEIEGLYRILLWAKSEHIILSQHVEVLKIANSFSIPYEENLVLKRNIPYFADLALIRGKVAAIQPPKVESLSIQFISDREFLTKTRLSLGTQFGITSVECSHLADLTVRQCTNALIRLSSVLSHLKTKPAILVIAGRKEAPEAFDQFTDPQTKNLILIVRENFNKFDIRKFYKSINWSYLH